MTCFGWARRCAVGVVLCLSLSGCFQAGDSQGDEKKEPHYLSGKSLVEQMDWQGAIDEFEKALEVNPHSASAHFELAWLCEEKVNPTDSAAAIYHYQQYLKLSPNPDKADLVKQHINTCKLELVKTMAAVGPLPSGAQRELERVVAENKSLQDQIGQLQAQITQLKSAATAAQAQAAQAQAQAAQFQAQVSSSRPVIERRSIESPRMEATHSNAGVRREYTSTHSRGTSSKTHVVRSRETMASIAREYGISLAALQSANPQVRPTHLIVGQALRIPTP